MKDLVSCFSEHAVRISDVGCSGGTSSGGASPAVESSSGSGRATQSTVTSVYRCCLAASQKHLLINVTWSRSLDGPALSIALHDRHRRAGERHLHRKKGSATFTAGSCVVAIFWDYAAARHHGSAPEPVSGFYVAVVADAEFVLLLGDMSREYVQRLHGGIPIAEFWMASRKERFVVVVGGQGCCSSTRSRVRLWETGAEHEIRIGWEEEEEEEVRVSVDDVVVLQLQRLRWNFRGNHTLFLEGGVPVDMMWDLHGWLYASPSSSCALFTFQPRTTTSSLLSADDEEEEEVLQHRQHQYHSSQPAGAVGGSGFCLMIQAFRSSSPAAANIVHHSSS